MRSSRPTAPFSTPELLTLLNERLFDNGGSRHAVPLTCLVSFGMYSAVLIEAGVSSQADVAFVDKIPKANSAILDPLLTLLNEHLFSNGASRHAVHLIFLVRIAVNQLHASLFFLHVCAGMVASTAHRC